MNLVVIKNKRILLDDIINWCNTTNLKYEFETDRQVINFWFDSEMDATLFALRWK